MNGPADDGLPPLREVIARHGLSARKSLGQNFILDLNLTRRIARAGGPLDGVTVVEVGPGPGGLTRALLAEGAARVLVIERDSRCIPAIEEISGRYPGQVRIVEDDALKVDWTRLAKPPARIVANLPYGVATELLLRWLSLDPWPSWFDRLVLMFQKEVAERLVAAPGTKAYGRLSILTRFRTSARIAFTLPPRAFTPSPKVESAVVVLEPRPTPYPGVSLRALERVTASAFGQRRKMLRAALKTLVSSPEDLLRNAEIQPTRRAEELDLAEFCALAREFEIVSR
ncbi:MAG: 16S rRNA (adenine(1518)-N(6)/adenine(1519)-N(6))-dimethyltransferase RsmA [Pseudomonadota bacterium]|nr:16S rRNA (adenine(1518)-N(6)/adenine(1519)-N(6))-dimethyltransferase RsmA [Pseudomonadota bacterium]